MINFSNFWGYGCDYLHQHQHNQYYNEVKSKNYFNFSSATDSNYLNLCILLKIDTDYSQYFNELQTIQEDAISILENQLHKDIAKTLNVCKFKNTSNKKIFLIDEGNYLSISAVTSSGQTLSGYSVYHDSDKFLIGFDSPITTNELQISFYTGYDSFDKMDKDIRRAVYITIDDLFDWEKSSYTVNAAKKSDVIDKILASHIKRFFWN